MLIPLSFAPCPEVYLLWVLPVILSISFPY